MQFPKIMTRSPKALLSRFPLLHTRSMEEAKVATTGLWQRHDVEIRGRVPFDSMVNSFRSKTGGLTFVDCKTPLRIYCEPVGDYFAVHMQLSGAVEHRLNGKKSDANPTRAVFVAPGQSMRMETLPGRALILNFNRDFFEPELVARGLNHSPTEQWALGFGLRNGPGHALKTLCIWAAAQLEQAGSPLEKGDTFAHLQKSMAEILIEALGAPGQSGPPPGKIQLADLESWVRERLSTPLSVQDLAQKVGVTPRAIQMAFREQRGCTPGQFLRDLRLDEARRLLATQPNKSVSDIAMGLGFLHLGRFSGSYLARFGELPSETRRKSGL
jgi:AraC-like DNA-binding protein